MSRSKVDYSDEFLKSEVELLCGYAAAESGEVSAKDQKHIVFCLRHIVDWYNNGARLGDFLTAVVKNDFIEACMRADDTNQKVLVVYARFLYNRLPVDYQEKARGIQ